VKDMLVVGTLVLSFAMFVTAHVAIAYGLAWREPRWRAIAAFVVVPLAPYWAWRERMRVRSGLWVAALALYVIAAVGARF
jgi:hypothetical protein